ncbi:MAG: glycosyltransferase family 39 protein [Lachnospiraceae bacterium]|nr:glycosyltransferase family 39 protein [Lachnospiraceae bacterium]
MLKDLKNNKLNRYRLGALLLFICVITALAWQSDDAYHAYIMARNLVLGNGFVYNVGERVTASSCPLFTLVIAAGYFVFRKMFLVSLLICVAFSAGAYAIVLDCFCKTKQQVIASFFVLAGSACFISYTTSGLENCLLFFLSALFLKVYFSKETYESKDLFVIAILVALIATTRMDAVLLVAPMAVYAYLAKREKVSFIKAVGLGLGGLSPFILWELFSVFYYGFFVPNTAFVKLGTGIPEIEYIKRGIVYLVTSAACDVLLILVPVFAVLCTVVSGKWKERFFSAGIVLYVLYVIYIGGDFMLGRHFTVLFFMSLICFLHLQNCDFYGKYTKIQSFGAAAVLAIGLLCNLTSPVITSQFLFGNGNSPIADERAGYFRYTSLFNNTLSYLKTGKLVLRNAWNEAGIDEIRQIERSGGIIPMVPGISRYYNPDLYLNDQYALGDPFLAKLPAVREENWRIGHMWREVPEGYNDSVYKDENLVEDQAAHEYLDVIWLITRGDLFDPARIRAIVDINLGKYDHLIDEYRKTLDENNRKIMR